METQNIEYKESWRDEYIKWICGFANAQGGKIYIGKDDKGNIKGITNGQNLLEEIPNKVRDILGIIVDVNLLTEDGKSFIEIKISPNPYPVSYKGEYHYRTGSTKQQLKGQALNQFILKKTGITWDSVPVNQVKVNDLRNDSFDIFREQALLSNRMERRDLELSNEELLDSLNLLDNGFIKRAGILLFHHDPEKWIPGAYIKIGFFKTDAELEFQDEIHGSILSQIERVMDLIYTKYLKAEISYNDITRVETYPFPKEAIREAVLNAIAHKFYGALIPIQISVYEDRLYISNDCIFPEDWTVEDLWKKHRSRPYNPLIANTLFRAGFIESWGRGIEKIRRSCEEANNPLPEYTIKKEDIMVMFKTLVSKTTQAPPKRHPSTTQDLELGKIERKIIVAIKEDSNLSQRQIAEKIGENQNTVKFHMRKMKNSNIIKHVGSSQKGKWIVMEE